MLLAKAFVRMFTSSVSRTAGSASCGAALFVSTAVLCRESATFLVVPMIMSSTLISPSSMLLFNFSRKNPIFVRSEPFAVTIFKSVRLLMALLMAIRADLAESPAEPASLASPCSSVITGSMVRPSTFSIGGGGLYYQRLEQQPASPGQ